MTYFKAKESELIAKMTLNEVYLRQLAVACEELRSEANRWLISTILGLFFAIGTISALTWSLEGTKSSGYRAPAFEPPLLQEVISVTLILVVIALLTWSAASFFRYLELRRVSGQATVTRSQILIAGYSASRFLDQERLLVGHSDA